MVFPDPTVTVMRAGHPLHPQAGARRQGPQAHVGDLGFLKRGNRCGERLRREQAGSCSMVAAATTATESLLIFRAVSTNGNRMTRAFVSGSSRASSLHSVQLWGNAPVRVASGAPIPAIVESTFACACGWHNVENEHAWPPVLSTGCKTPRKCRAPGETHTAISSESVENPNRRPTCVQPRRSGVFAVHPR